MNFTPIFVAILCVFAGGIRAQPPPPKAPPVDVRFSLYSWRTGTPELHFGKGLKTEKLDPFSRSAVQSYAGPATLGFYTAPPAPAPDGTLPAPRVSVVFPTGATKFTLLTTAVGGGDYRMFVVPEDDAATPPPAIRVYNFSGSRLLVAYDDRAQIELQPASDTVIKPRGAATVIRVAEWREGKWRRLFNNVIELDSAGRKNVVLAPDQGRSVRLFSLPAWPLEAGPAAPSKPGAAPQP